MSFTGMEVVLFIFYVYAVMMKSIKVEGNDN